jgi:hypothetical protein
MTIKYEELLDEEGSIFHCPIISKIRPYAHFMALTKCFHIIDSVAYVRKEGFPRYTS